MTISRTGIREVSITVGGSCRLSAAAPHQNLPLCTQKHRRHFCASTIWPRRNASALRELPVWLVSSGPLDDSAEERDIPPTAQVAKLAGRVGARGHVTFGGRLEPGAKGFPVSAMAKTKAGDWRNPAHVRRWVTTVVNERDRLTVADQT
jgi:hypothetical protein